MTVTRGHLGAQFQLPANFRVQTDRLHLVPSLGELAGADWNQHHQLSQLLGAAVPAEWPPDLVIDHHSPNGEGWWDWYIVKHDDGQPVLIGMAGLKGWPMVSADVQLGCAFLPEFQSHAYGTEAVEALTAWALSQLGVQRVTAETPVDNQGAIAVLTSLGFGRLESDDPALLRFGRSL